MNHPIKVTEEIINKVKDRSYKDLGEVLARLKDIQETSKSLDDLYLNVGFMY